MSLCGMPYEDCDECSDVWREKRVRARKQHRCCECQATIEPGEEYGRADSLYDGQWDSLSRCAACLILAELAATLAGECAQWGGLEYQIEGLACEHPDLPTPWDHREKWEKAGR